MPGGAAARFDDDPSAYAEYLRTPLGRLRSELSWRNLEPHLPRPGSPPPRAVDLGAGTGELGLRLAAAGWSVTLVDGSRRMLERAAALAETRGVGPRIACRALDLDAGGVAAALGPGEYDLVVCHDVLEFVASPEALLGEAVAMLAAAGRMSVVVRNLAGELLKRLLRGATPADALSILATRRVREEMYGLDARLFDPGELGRLLGAAGLDVVAEHGVRVAADHLADWAGGGDGAFDGMVELERRLGASPELRAAARYVQAIGARSQVPGRAARPPAPPEGAVTPRPVGETSALARGAPDRTAGGDGLHRREPKGVTHVVRGQVRRAAVRPRPGPHQRVQPDLRLLLPRSEPR